MGKPTWKHMVILRKHRYKMPSKLDYAYAAGIIDADGCIQIINDTSSKWNSWTLRVDVCNNSTKILDKLTGVFGGRRCVQKSGNKIYKGDFKRRHVCYNWTVQGSNAYSMLKKIKIYLKEKKAQATVGIEFFIHQKQTSKKRKKGLSEAVIKKRLQYKQKIKDLKTAFLIPIVPAETKRENAVMGEAIVQSS